VRWATLNKNGDLDGMTSPHLNTGKFRKFYESYIYIHTHFHLRMKEGKLQSAKGAGHTSKLTKLLHEQYIYIYRKLHTHTHIYIIQRERELYRYIYIDR
jgi:hypothetical protein